MNLGLKAWLRCVRERKLEKQKFREARRLAEVQNLLRARFYRKADGATKLAVGVNVWQAVTLSTLTEGSETLNINGHRVVFTCDPDLHPNRIVEVV